MSKYWENRTSADGSGGKKWLKEEVTEARKF
jgi:hypothetical protein